MNIIIISYIYPKKVNPAHGIFVHQQAKYLAREGNSVHVITTRSHGDKKEEVRDNVKIHRVASISFPKIITGFLFMVNTLLKIFKLNNKKKIDLVIGEFLGLTTISLGLFLKLLGSRFVAISHGAKWEIPKRNVVYGLLIRFVSAFPEKIICVSRQTKELLSRNANKSKLHVINNGMDPEYLAPSKSAKEFKKQLGIGNKQVILSVSNLVTKKGLDVIIRAIAKISEKCPNIIHLIVGDGYDREKLQNLVKELNLGKYVRFEGRKVGSELANYYNICDVFVLMSRDIEGEIESFGIVYIEASYFGKPVIGGVSGGTSDAVVNGKTGFLIDSKDQKRLEKTILLLLKDSKLRKRLGKAGRKRVLKQFLWEHNAEKLTKICTKQ